MHYDKIKEPLGRFFNRAPWMRKLFYGLLDLLLLRAWHANRELRKWSKTAPYKAKILDAGSGFGQYTYRMARMGKGYNILAVDVKDEQVADCNEFFSKVGLRNVHFQVDDLTTFKRDNTYDLILCVDVMEHIEDDVQVLKNYYASLKAGGQLIISTPSDQGGSDVHDEDGTSFIEEHVRDGYGIEEIREKMQLAGFSQIKPRYQYGNPGQISWRLSMKWPMQMLSISKAFFIILPFYYLITFPFAAVLNWFDTRIQHRSGTGLVVLGWK